jgi:hypothetical protein
MAGYSENEMKGTVSQKAKLARGAPGLSFTLGFSQVRRRAKLIGNPFKRFPPTIMAYGQLAEARCE